MLDGKRIAILVEEGFEGLELAEPMRAMKAANGRVVIVGAATQKSHRSRNDKKMITAELAAEAAKAGDFDTVIIVGGHHRDTATANWAMVELVRQAHQLGRVVAAASGGQQLLILAGIVKGRRLTSPPSLAPALRNAGADWVDEAVVRDGNIITSRKPADIPMFNKAIIDTVAAGIPLSDNLQQGEIGATAHHSL